MHPKQPLGRKDIQILLGVERTEATRILKIVGCDEYREFGGNVTHAENVLVYLDSIQGRTVPKRERKNTSHKRTSQMEAVEVAIGEAETERRRDFASRLAEIIRLRPVKDIAIGMSGYRPQDQTFEGLPQEISIAHPDIGLGVELRIHATDAYDFAEKLCRLSNAMLYDWERFVELTGEQVSKVEEVTVHGK
jgi:hypothetical protein